MRLNDGDVTVESGTGVTQNPSAPFVPIIQLKASDDGGEVCLHLTPGNARRIGIDLIAAASMAWANAGMRIYAKEHGADGDSMIAYVQMMVKADLGVEE